MSRPYVQLPDFRTLDAEATLGEIDRVLKAEGKRTTNPAQLWALSDEKFSWRADYRVLGGPCSGLRARRGFPKRGSPVRWFPSQSQSCIYNQNGRSTVNTWSILMMTSGIVTRREGQIFSFNSLDRLVNAADYAMANGLAPLRGYLKSCALIRALTADAVQKFRFRYYEPMSVAHARQYVADLIAQLKVASPRLDAWSRPFIRIRRGNDVSFFERGHVLPRDAPTLFGAFCGRCCAPQRSES